ncbi:MAG: DUF6462 family protein [Lachnospiraceae bacterium]|nr:DUF6462 family protein [Lachnospiraceae bacterium]
MKELLQKEDDVLQKLGTVEQAMKRYSLGETNMRRVGNEAGAIVRIGKSVRFNFTILDRYMDRISGGL